MDVNKWVEDNQDKFTQVSDQIWRFAELGYQESQSAELLASTLEEAGFTLEREVAGIPTAFVASYGSGKPVIAILGEYDALPGLSQDAVPHRKPLAEGENGHGCGHNLLGAGSLVAALVVKEAIAASGLDVKGTVRYYGCPAEENGSAKAFMVKTGVFGDVDLSLTWHPGMFNGSMSVNMLANYKIEFKFHGRASHAAADPHNGRSALDAVELMNVGVNYLREHIIPEARIHYVITNGGGSAPNVVPPEAASLYLIRAPRPDQLRELYDRVINIAKGAALMTDTEVETVFHAGASNLVFNDTIVDVLHEKMHEVGAPHFGEEEQQFAREIASTFPKGGMDSFASLLGPEIAQMLAAMKEVVLVEGILPAFKKDIVMPGSSDVGDVSWVTPTGQIMTTCQAFGTPGHSWQAVAQGGTSIGHKGMLFAGKVLGLSAIEFMTDPQKLKKAQDEFASRIRTTPFVSPIPDGVKPPLYG
ncbi:MAG: M20 family metallopeptidase [Chloroflexota bacterium]|nr:M20 family metallopeptidase [Chloroflexota bacterium]